MAQEPSDVLVYLIRLADKCHIALSLEVLDKIEHNKRKYPIDQVYGRSEKYTEYENHKN